jgi:hypothetical protein
MVDHLVVAEVDFGTAPRNFAFGGKSGNWLGAPIHYSAIRSDRSAPSLYLAGNEFCETLWTSLFRSRDHFAHRAKTIATEVVSKSIAWLSLWTIAYCDYLTIKHDNSPQVLTRFEIGITTIYFIKPIGPCD